MTVLRQQVLSRHSRRWLHFSDTIAYLSDLETIPFQPRETLKVTQF